MGVETERAALRLERALPGFLVVMTDAEAQQMVAR